MDFSLLKDFMDSLTDWRIPGNAVSVHLDGKEVFSYSSGFADVEKGIPMSTQKLVYIYSCSKVATVTAGLQLYEKGLFLLDDPLYDFIPEYRDMYINDNDGSFRKAKNPITLRHLFTMTSGLTYNSDTPAFCEAYRKTNGRMNTLETVKCLAKDPISFEPGERWQYSLSHDVLAAVIEVISGKRFSEYMKENIFEPLSMNSTYYHADESIKAEMAQQYHFRNSDETSLAKLQSADTKSNEKGGFAEVAGKENHNIFGEEYDSGGAGIITSVEDYSLLCSALANGGKGILSKGTVDLLRTNQLTTPELMKNFNWPQLKGYGYGLGVRTLTDKAKSGTTGSIGEFGWGGAAGATVLVDPDRHLSLFYAHHMLNPQESYYQPRLRNVLYACLDR
ncbi:MAG: beta-lactamase family protein [Clostridia bacterium]|nr:beta-lactamase family protein [Clostridia bacterium]